MCVGEDTPQKLRIFGHALMIEGLAGLLNRPTSLQLQGDHRIQGKGDHIKGASSLFKKTAAVFCILKHIYVTH